MGRVKTSIYRHSLIVRWISITLVAVLWARFAFCGEIHDAAKNNDLERIEALLKDSPDLLVTKDNRGYTPLHSAAESALKGLLFSNPDRFENHPYLPTAFLDSTGEMKPPAGKDEINVREG